VSGLPKEKLARELGYGGAMDALEHALQEARLSRPEKRNISPAKRASVAELIAERFLLVCRRGDCQAETRDDDRMVVAASSPEFCEVCGGSPVSASLRTMVDACQTAGIRRLVVIGGSPTIRTRLERELGSALELRLVDGTVARTAVQARDDLAWADVVVLWGSSELAHKATMAYPVGNPKVVRLVRRGIPALAREVVRHARAR
jgi:hypothetical protein